MVDNRIDVARNLKIIEGLKVQLLTVVAELYSGLYRGQEDSVVDALAAAVVILFSMADRLGVDIRRMDAAIEDILRDRASNPDNSLRRFETQLLSYWRGKLNQER